MLGNSKVCLSLMNLLLTSNFGWSRTLSFTGIWSPVSLLLYGFWQRSITITSRKTTKSCFICPTTPSGFTCIQRKVEPTVTNVWRLIATVLKDKKGGTGYDLAFIQKQKQESFNVTRWCVFTKIYINLFSGVFRTKCKEQIRWKSNTQSRRNFFQETGFREGRIRVNLLMFTGGRQAPGFLFLDSM